MNYYLEWFDIDKPPKTQTKVLIMASNRNYNSGYPRLLSGVYIDRYYDTPINEFRITGVEAGIWTPVKWAYAPNTHKVSYEIQTN